jgi:PAS domain S-box-containing protein
MKPRPMVKSKPKKTRAFRARSRPKPAHRALSEANQRLQPILFANEIATWTWDIEANRVIADENLERLFGISAKDASGGPLEHYLQFVHPDDQSAVAAAIAKALEGPDDKYATEYRLVRKDHTTSWVSARGRVERGRNGKARYFPGVIIDITDRKSLELKSEELRHRLEQQARIFNTALSSITDFAYVFDRQGRFVFVNQPLLNLWGLKLEDAVGKNFHDLKYPTPLATRLQSQIQQVFDTKSGLTDETPYESPTGAGGYYEYIFSPVFDRDGNVEMVAGSTRDISERKRVERELQNSQESYRVLAQSLERQVQERTVELEQRNNDVLSQSEQLRSLSVRLIETQDHEARRLARELHDSAGQMIAALAMNLDRLISSLRSSNPDLVKLAKETRTCAEDLGQEIRTTSYLLHPPLLDEVGLRAALDWYVEGLKQRSGLDVRLNFYAGFDRLSRDIELTIFRVVQECLTNIHRHSGSKQAEITITRDGDDVLLEVRDAGRGIAQDRLAKIQTKSVGLGLRGIRERIRQFSGDLRIESLEGAGTTITVTLPLGPT